MRENDFIRQKKHMYLPVANTTFNSESYRFIWLFYVYMMLHS